MLMQRKDFVGSLWKPLTSLHEVHKFNNIMCIFVSNVPSFSVLIDMIMIGICVFLIYTTNIENVKLVMFISELHDL